MYANEYDLWFEKNRPAYESEIALLKKLIPDTGIGLEIGIGTGRFSYVLGIEWGIDPAHNMLLLAKKRGIKVLKAEAEALPFKDSSFDFVAMITVLSFLSSPITALKEAKRVVRDRGYLIIGMIDAESALGRAYESKKEKSKFYSHARFYPVKDLISWLKGLQFCVVEIYQTLFQDTCHAPIKKGYGEGGFVGILAKKWANPLPYSPSSLQ